MANNINSYPLAGKPLGAPPAVANALKDTEHNSDHLSLSDFPAVRYIRGVECTDKASDAAHCEIWLEAVGGSRDTADANCWASVYYNGTHIWWAQVQIAGGQAFLSFADADCESHTVPGIGNYALPAFIDALHIFIWTYPSGSPQLTAHQLLLSATAPGGIHSNSIPRSAAVAVAGSIEEALDDIETEVGSVIAPGGGLLANVVNASTVIANDALAEEGYENIIWGQMDVDDDLNGAVNRWQAYLGAVLAVDAANAKIGTASQQVTTALAGQGCNATGNTYRYQDFAGEYVNFSAWVLVAVNNTAYLEVTDGVNVGVSAAGGVAGTWTRLNMTFLVNAVPLDLQFRVLANAATVFSVDGGMATRGRKQKCYSVNPVEANRIFMLQEDQTNWMPNSDFREFTGPALGAGVTLPNFWRTGIVGINQPALSSQSVAAGTWLFNGASWFLQINNGEGAYFDIINWADFVGYSVKVSMYMRLDAASPAADPIRLRIDDGVAPQFHNVTPTVPWQRPGCDLTVNAAATRLRVSVENQAGGAGRTDVYIDGIMLQKGGWPGFNIAYRPSVVYKPYVFTFARGGAVGPGGGLMAKDGAAVDSFVPGKDIYFHKITLFAGTAPGGAVVDQYDVWINGAPSGILTTLTAAQQAATAHLPALVAYNQTDRLAVNITAGMGTAAADVIAAVEGIGIGY